MLPLDTILPNSTTQLNLSNIIQILTISTLRGSEYGHCTPKVTFIRLCLDSLQTFTTTFFHSQLLNTKEMMTLICSSDRDTLMMLRSINRCIILCKVKNYKGILKRRNHLFMKEFMKQECMIIIMKIIIPNIGEFILDPSRSIIMNLFTICLFSEQILLQNFSNLTKIYHS